VVFCFNLLIDQSLIHNVDVNAMRLVCQCRDTARARARTRHLHRCRKTRCGRLHPQYFLLRVVVNKPSPLNILIGSGSLQLMQLSGGRESRPDKHDKCGVHTTVPSGRPSAGRSGVVSGVHRCVRRLSAVCPGYVRRMSIGR